MFSKKTEVAIVAFLLSTCTICVHGQMNFQGENLFGNEWIDFSKSYQKFIINQDGIYRITYQELIAQGLPSDIKVVKFKFIHSGN